MLDADRRSAGAGGGPLTPVPSPPRGEGETLPVALWGRFREATVDRFTIDVAKGQAISFEAVGNRFGKDVDPLVTIRDAKGKIVAEHDNDPGLYFDCRFAHMFAAGGTYTVEMRDARFHGDEHGLWVLRMGKFPAVRWPCRRRFNGASASSYACRALSR